MDFNIIKSALNLTFILFFILISFFYIVNKIRNKKLEKKENTQKFFWKFIVLFFVFIIFSTFICCIPFFLKKDISIYFKLIPLWISITHTLIFISFLIIFKGKNIKIDIIHRKK